ncbi:MAG: MepB family protein [Candidatus Pristimantibacillus lignocellulolyticus]|uniref:MepB family protein n=1 Tax=Candidatus Pristimantibacillus lignocellulolyticus TaxID=2994561 RepID=A0A9J6ZBR1_9BACL|nr:MAG: MepB family protein [Candidatus Pristimantibacillus lignocellulolyticus]
MIKQDSTLSNPNTYVHIIETSPTPLQGDLIEVIKRIYSTPERHCTLLLEEPHNADYGSYFVKLNLYNIRFRVAKITPTKVGQFVTIWERNENGAIQPYDISEPIDYYVICAREGNNFGQFVFPSSVLRDQDILADQGVGGKRAIRIYPPWDVPTSRHARNTQKWQLPYFLDLSLHLPIDEERIRQLYKPLR